MKELPDRLLGGSEGDFERKLACHIGALGLELLTIFLRQGRSVDILDFGAPEAAKASMRFLIPVSS